MKMGPGPADGLTNYDKIIRSDFDPSMLKWWTVKPKPVKRVDDYPYDIRHFPYNDPDFQAPFSIQQGGEQVNNLPLAYPNFRPDFEIPLKQSKNMMWGENESEEEDEDDDDEEDEDDDDEDDDEDDDDDDEDEDEEDDDDGTEDDDDEDEEGEDEDEEEYTTDEEGVEEEEEGEYVMDEDGEEEEEYEGVVVEEEVDEVIRSRRSRSREVPQHKFRPRVEQLNAKTTNLHPDYKWFSIKYD